MQIDVVDVGAGEFYCSKDGKVSGSTTNVTLCKTNDDGSTEYARCEGMLYVEEEEQEVLAEIFEEWQAYAQNNEEGYSYWKV